jgi:hypothetical protein
VAAYPSGFAFEVLTMAARAGGEEELLDPLLFGHHRHRMRAGQAGLPPEMLRMGVQFADGGKATNTNTSRLDPRDPGEPPSGPVMHQGGGGGGGGSWHQSHWVWPLPPPGPLAFVCEWPAAGIALTRHEVDAQPILDAAARATVIFAEEESPGGPRWTSYGAPPQVVVRKTPE